MVMGGKYLSAKSTIVGGIFGNIKLNAKFIFEINYNRRC